MKYDHQKVPRLKRWLHRRFVGPWRKRIAGQKYLKHRLDDLDSPFAFYPLHTEPELTLHVYAREFVNQIEIIRLIASSLPVGMKLVVKEHPATFGRRKLGYYQKLAEIPGVVLLRTDLPASKIIEKSEMVFVITGTTALEAIYIGKPVIYFGRVPFSHLPSHVVQQAEIRNLHLQIKSLLASYVWDEPVVQSFVASLLAGGAPVNLITEVLKKSGRLNLTSSAQSYDQNMDQLELLFERSLNDRRAYVD